MQDFFVGVWINGRPHHSFCLYKLGKLAHGVSLFGDTDQKKPQKTLEEAGTPEENQEEPGSSQEAGTPEEPEAAKKPGLQKNLKQPRSRNTRRTWSSQKPGHQKNLSSRWTKSRERAAAEDSFHPCRLWNPHSTMAEAYQDGRIALEA